MKKVFYSESAAELNKMLKPEYEKHVGTYETSPELDSDEMKLKYKYVFVRLLKDKELRDFVLKEFGDDPLLGSWDLLEGMHENPPHKVKIIKNKKNKYQIEIEIG